MCAMNIASWEMQLQWKHWKDFVKIWKNVLNICTLSNQTGLTLTNNCKSMQTMVSQGSLLIEKFAPNVLVISIQWQKLKQNYL
jgi:hypothetical protein